MIQDEDLGRVAMGCPGFCIFRIGPTGLFTSASLLDRGLEDE
jgi:hypothetical protein